MVWLFIIILSDFVFINYLYNNTNQKKNIIIIPLLILFVLLDYFNLPFLLIYLIYIIIQCFIVNSIFIQNCCKSVEYIKGIIQRLIVELLSYYIIENLFVGSLTFNGFNLFLPLKVLWLCMRIYIQYFFYLFLYKPKLINRNLSNRYFKTLSLVLSLCYSFCIIYNNRDLFYFETIGRTMVFTLIVYNAALIAFDRYQVKHERIEREFAEKEKQFALVQQKQRIQDEYNQLLEREQKHVRNIQHDMNNHLMAMLGYIDRQDVDGVRKYVNDLLDESKRASQKVYTGHVSVDAILDAKILKARSLGIDVKESFEVVSFGIMKCVDLTKLLGCALDNAIEAILRIEDDTKKKLQIRMYNNGPYLIVCIGNSIAKGIDVDFSHTSKTYDEKNHGFGVKDIKSIAFEYDGSAYYEFEKDFVMLNVILYVKRDV